MSDEKDKAEPEKLSDRLIERLIAALKDRKNPDGALQKKWHRFQRIFLYFNIAYTLVFLILLYALKYHGESGIILSVLLFLPAWGWIIPSLLITPLCLLVKARLIPIHVLLIIIVLWGYMGLELNSPSEVKDGVLVMSYNHGQRNRTSMSDVVNQMKPDVIALQDAGNRLPKYRKRYPDHHLRQVGEFLLISRFPIVSAEPVVKDPTDDDRTIAARYEVYRKDLQRMVIYNVHLPTPRRELARLRSNRFHGMLPSRALLKSEGRHRYLDFLDNKLQLAREVARKVAEERLPCLVVGDFNTPPAGVVYRAVSENLVDAFDERGRGYGFTFPGNTRALYSFGNPWLRLDYIFCNASWSVEAFHTEEKRQSQHRAVFARLTLRQE